MLFVFGTALSFRYFDPGEALYFRSAYRMHMSLGMFLLAASLSRVLWRVSHRYPQPSAGMSCAMRIAAKSAHVLLYLFIVIVPMTGWIVLSTRRSPATLVGPIHWPNLWPFAGMTHLERIHYNDMLLPVHAFLSYVGMCLAGLHASAALYHRLFRGDEVLHGMLPRRRLRDPGVDLNRGIER